ncbi:cytochrome c oxidase subunit 4, mitochondrial [Saitoella complicata NRRL Y-17804]|uniref:cytochrome c oxidase subunit 4, mitochondrial n=1 Tax=Saitoella complicata (strain BCRC 22490 / CBS 7301 / JCM 7358 / NBRC 10748 / NRRL Y-17804) TaxID=698492 RepID=UPI0008676278|nr:cytochrome c oxidase subunit 4, mitochondrial [Saitoella complicata NRRL Y-17804]ODQ50235.1 cytochrome c oxidase subunit 4, mitochondrial [Saitoella complicata NRRL Y-17804]
MFALRRTLATGVRQVAARRTFSSALVLRNENKQVEALQKEFEQVKGFDDLLPAGAPEGTVPTEANQATGLERFEYLAKVAGVEPFDMAPLDASRLGTMKDPIMVPSLEPMRIIGCTGYPADSHEIMWMRVHKDGPNTRCFDGSVYKLNHTGNPDADPHHH